MDITTRSGASARPSRRVPPQGQAEEKGAKVSTYKKIYLKIMKISSVFPSNIPYWGSSDHTARNLRKNHLHVIKSNTLQSQGHCEGLRALPLKSMECEHFYRV